MIAVCMLCLRSKKILRNHPAGAIATRLSTKLGGNKYSLCPKASVGVVHFVLGQTASSDVNLESFIACSLAFPFVAEFSKNVFLKCRRVLEKRTT